MTRLNWNRQDYRMQREELYKKQREQEDLKEIIRQSKRWRVGRHRGSLVSNLPVRYLIWVSETFETESPYKHRADRELVRRYNLLKPQKG